MASTEIQTIIFPKSKWTKDEAIKWLREHEFDSEIDETEESYRARQKEPSSFQDDSFRTICLSPNDVDAGSDECRIKAVIGRIKAVAAKFFTSKVDLEKFGYSKVENVHILKKGKINNDIEIGDKELREIVEMFERRRNEGNYPVIFIGHSKSQENPIYGFIDNLRIDGDNLVGDFYLDHKNLELLRYYPRRSAELWLENGQYYLDGVALLGSSAPRFDMGILIAASKRSNCGCSKEGIAMSDQPPGIIEEIAKIWKKIEDLEKEVLDIIGQKTNVTSAADSGTCDYETEEKREAATMANDFTQMIEAQKKEIEQLKIQLSEERAKRVRIERQAVLQELANTYDFNIEKELLRCEKMDDKQFEEHVQLIRDNYRVKTDRNAKQYPNFSALSKAPDDIEDKIHEEALQLANASIFKGKYMPYSECYQLAKEKLLGVKQQ